MAASVREDSFSKRFTGILVYIAPVGERQFAVRRPEIKPGMERGTQERTPNIERPTPNGREGDRQLQPIAARCNNE